ncbi:MAG: V-type ATP synthase subunit E [Methanosarcinaceae archaeon]
MGLETVVKDITDVANAEATKISSEADAEASSILDEARQSAKNIMGNRLAKAEDDIKKLRQQETSSANLEVKRTMLNARKEVLNKVDKKGADIIANMPSSKNEELLKAIIDKHQGNGNKIYSNKSSEELVKNLSSLSYAGNIDCSGGVIIENEDGTIRLNYTYDIILESVNEKSMKQISDILFG